MMMSHPFCSSRLVLMLALGACVQTVPPAPSGPLRVTNNGAPFGFDQGGPARRVAEAECGAQGRRLASGIYDRYEGGAWVYPGGCV